MTRPTTMPIGWQLQRAAKEIGRAFDEALTAVGGSHPIWMVLLALKSGGHASQREIAESAGIQGATLTHHLNAMEADGLVVRRRDPTNRRVHVVDLTEAGEALFLRLRDAAVDFDRRLRTGVPDAEVDRFRSTLERLQANAL
jgi:MarR family transcriptional regulator for hemolysin